MSKRTRLKEIMTRAGLIDDELALERAKAQRGAQTTNATLHALSSLVDTGANVVPRAYDVAADHMAQDAMAPHATTTPEGDAATEAARAVEGAEGLQPSAAQDPLSFIVNAVKAPARDEARRRARTGLTERFAANQDRARELGRQQVEDQRRTTEFEQGQQDRALSFAADGLQRRARLASEPLEVGDLIDDMPLGEDETPHEATRASLVASLGDLGLDEVTSGSVADSLIARAEAAKTAEEKAAVDEQIERITQGKKLEEIDSRIAKNNAQAAKASRPPARKKTVADFGPDEILPKDLQAHPKVTEKMVEFEMLQASLDDVLATKQALKVDTGPVKGLISDIADFLGIEAIEPASLRAMTGEVFARYVQSISGAAASDAEVQRLMRNMATMRDQDDVFEAKIGVMKRLTELRKQSLLRTYQKAGWSLGRWTVEPPQPTGTVTVSNGVETFQIDAADLGEAEADGYQRVQ